MSDFNFRAESLLMWRYINQSLYRCTCLQVTRIEKCPEQCCVFHSLFTSAAAGRAEICPLPCISNAPFVFLLVLHQGPIIHVSDNVNDEER